MYKERLRNSSATIFIYSLLGFLYASFTTYIIVHIFSTQSYIIKTFINLQSV